MDYEKELLKRAIVSGASHALKYRKDRKVTSDEEVIQRVTREASEIIDKIQEED